MKRAWRFIKWFIAKSTWFDFVIFTTAFTLAAGFSAGEGTARNVFWIIAFSINVLFIAGFMAKGVINLWRDFKKHDEKVFEILKQEKIK